MDALAALRWWQEVSALEKEMRPTAGCGGAVLLLLGYGPLCRAVAGSGKLPMIVALCKSKHHN